MLPLLRQLGNVWKLSRMNMVEVVFCTGANEILPELGIDVGSVDIDVRADCLKLIVISDVKLGEHIVGVKISDQANDGGMFE